MIRLFGIHLLQNTHRVFAEHAQHQNDEPVEDRQHDHDPRPALDENIVEKLAHHQHQANKKAEKRDDEAGNRDEAQRPNGIIEQNAQDETENAHQVVVAFAFVALFVLDPRIANRVRKHQCQAGGVGVGGMVAEHALDYVAAHQAHVGWHNCFGAHEHTLVDEANQPTPEPARQ